MTIIFTLRSHPCYASYHSAFTLLPLLPHAFPSSPPLVLAPPSILSQMKSHLYSSPMPYHPSSSPSYLSSPPQRFKRKLDDEEGKPPESAIFLPKKPRLHITTEASPSPPNAFTRLTPPFSDAGGPETPSPLPLPNKMTISTHITPSSSSSVENTLGPPWQEGVASHQSNNVQTPISEQNVLLRELHMNSRIYQNNKAELRLMQEDDMEIMWQEEEEVVAERYAQMNKILGTRGWNQ